jgi:hypothetical protein
VMQVLVGLTHVGVMRSATWVATKRSTLA